MKFSLLFLAVSLLISSLVFAETASLEKIILLPGKNMCALFFKAKGKLYYQSSLLQKPPRILLSFNGIKNKTGGQDFVFEDNPYVSDVRVNEQKNGAADSLQIVVALKSVFDFSFTPASEGFMLQLKPVKPNGANSNVVNPNPDAHPNAAARSLASLQTVTKTPEVPQPAAGPDITIGPEDMVKVSVFELTQFDTETRVSGDGTITMPLVGSIKIQGLTKVEAEKKIAAALEAKYIANPSVSVSITEYKSKQVSILGAVSKPGPYYILHPRTLIQLISEAGGLTTDAGKKGFIFRQGSPNIELDLEGLMKTGDPKLNVSILPGDVINIPPTKKVIVYVLGAVKSPGSVELDSDMPTTLVAAIAKAGGLGDGAKSDVQITRTDANGKQKVLKANLKDILNGKAADIALFAGDVINVRLSFF